MEKFLVSLILKKDKYNKNIATLKNDGKHITINIEMIKILCASFQY